MHPVSAVIPTRGDVDLEPVLESIRPHVWDIVVYDNSAREDLKVYGRFAAMREAQCPTIYTQDDDALVPVGEIIAAYDGDELLVNVPYGEKPWLAWGAVFVKDTATSALQTYLDQHDFDDYFLRWPDVIFASLVDWRSVDLGREDLPHAFGPNRMYRQPDHYSSQEMVERRCLELGGTVARA